MQAVLALDRVHATTAHRLRLLDIVAASLQHACHLSCHFPHNAYIQNMTSFKDWTRALELVERLAALAAARGDGESTTAAAFQMGDAVDELLTAFAVSDQPLPAMWRKMLSKQVREHHREYSTACFRPLWTPVALVDKSRTFLLCSLCILLCRVSSAVHRCLNSLQPRVSRCSTLFSRNNPPLPPAAALAAAVRLCL